MVLSLLSNRNIRVRQNRSHKARTAVDEISRRGVWKTQIETKTYVRGAPNVGGTEHAVGCHRAEDNYDKGKFMWNSKYEPGTRQYSHRLTSFPPPPCGSVNYGAKGKQEKIVVWPSKVTFPQTHPSPVFGLVLGGTNTSVDVC